jgi:hypothetical protein
MLGFFLMLGFGSRSWFAHHSAGFFRPQRFACGFFRYLMENTGFSYASRGAIRIQL